jgi:nucleoid DNA-binding protein
MTKTELQSALAEATQTDKKTAGVFLDTLSAIAYKGTKKNGEFVLPGFGKLVKQKRRLAPASIPRRNRRSRFQPRPSSNSESPRPRKTRFWG